MTESISECLQKSLDLINEDYPVKSSSRHESTASSILLAEKRREKQLTQGFLGDFIPVNRPLNDSNSLYLNQIAESTTEPPTYWKSSKKPVAVKSSVSIIGKAKKKLHQKGEDYKDRLLHRQISKSSKNNRILSLKTSKY